MMGLCYYFSNYSCLCKGYMPLKHSRRDYLKMFLDIFHIPLLFSYTVVGKGLYSRCSRTRPNHILIAATRRVDTGVRQTPKCLKQHIIVKQGLQKFQYSILYLILTITWYFDTPSKNLPDLTGNLELKRKLNVAFLLFSTG